MSTSIIMRCAPECYVVLIQREMVRKLELEKLRLKLQIAQALGYDAQSLTEKPKRTTRLTDDGELLPEDSLTNSSLRRSDAKAS
jgi:hypothetical protein